MELDQPNPPTEAAQNPTAVREWVVAPAAPVEYKACPREEAATVTSYDWCIFALHNNYIRPIRDHEWYHGEPCRLRSFGSGKMFELPPGSVPYSSNSLGHPATSWDPFVFPNPPREFLMSQRRQHPSIPRSYMLGPPQPTCGIVGIGLRGQADFRRNGNLTYFRRRISPQELRTAAIPPIELDDLERQLWSDPEPRFEKPFKTYADSKYCTKGALVDVRQLMRPGW